MNNYIKWFNEVGMKDVAIVGGKNASLGEMITELTDLGIKVPFGFATTSQAYLDFLKHNDLENRIYKLLDKLDVTDVSALNKSGTQIRELIRNASFQKKLEEEIIQSWQQLSHNNEDFSLAIRSSATAEDLAHASFAGQQESYLNIRGKDNVLAAIKNVYASLYNDRAIAYRVHNQFKHSEVAISVGIQQMVRSDLAASGVMFTLDTESGFDQVIFITSSYGLGEAVVQGSVNPDEFYVHKPTLKTGKASIVSRKLGSKAVKMLYCTE